MTSFLPHMAGANSIYGSGMLELGQTFSLEQLVIDNDIINMERRALEGIPVTDETLAVDVIKEVGVGNDFIGHPTTMENMEMPSNPLVFNRDMLGDWKSQGSKSCVEVAHEVVLDVMKNHIVPKIDPEIDAKIRAIVKEADDSMKF
ncbi:MAG: trimethylamine methyltransferase family protein [Candidatus Methanomethylophilaceae archaeon]|nr:trimethylamine methyltransferase family protein [Candidatus Methanomethylophilaceae archaeon]